MQSYICHSQGHSRSVCSLTFAIVKDISGAYAVLHLPESRTLQECVQSYICHSQGHSRSVYSLTFAIVKDTPGVYTVLHLP